MKSKNNQSRRGVIGIESAIVMIAFVIVAAALSFVVLNMGLSTTQQAKQSITTSLDTVSGSLQISGNTIGIGHVNTGFLNATEFPVTVAGSNGAVNLDPSVTIISYTSNGIQYGNIYLGSKCLITSPVENSVNATLQAAVTSGCISSNPMIAGGTWPSATTAIVAFTAQKNTNTVLEQGEDANIVIVYSKADRPSQTNSFKAELTPATGSVLTVDRTVPPILGTYVDMG